LHQYSAFPRLGRGKPLRFLFFLESIGAKRLLNPPGSFSSAVRRTDTQTCIVTAVKV
jgi:hypothetical protein